MRVFFGSVALSLCTVAVSVTAAAQDTPNPVSTALRNELQRGQRNLVGAAESMPADKFGFKPTPAQMSFGQLVLHVAGSNDYLCSAISGTKAPDRTKLQPTDSKDSIVARVKESFDFCNSALAQLTDAQLGANIPFFGGRQVSRAQAILGLAGDWYDHYSAAATYLRLNGILPPTARPRT